MDKIATFFTQSTYFIQQVKEWAEIVLNFETANKYKIENSQGSEIGGIYETGHGFLKVLARLILRSHRPITIEVVDKDSSKILQLHRPFFFIWSNLTIQDTNQKKLGWAKRRFGFLLFKRYDLLDQHGNLFGKICSPFWRIWTFKIACPKTQQELAIISKKWGGILKETFSDADRFGVTFSSPNLTLEQKATIFSTAITVDFDFFEDNSNSISNAT